MHPLQLHKLLLRDLFLPPGCNYNYMNYSPANYLCNNFVDHGQDLSFPATEPLDPRRVSEGFVKGVSERVSEVFLKCF